MPIWSAEIKELEKLNESFKGQLPDLEKELGKLIKADDENMILLYSRRCLEVIITDLCECELKRPRKTEPLKGIIDKLHKEEKVPSHIISSMHGLNELSTYGAHPKDFDPEQVKPVLVNLDIIIKWYLKYKNIVTVVKAEVDEEKIRLREEVTLKERTEVQEKPAKAGKRKLLSIVVISAIILISALLAYPKIFKRDTLEKLRSSGERIAVVVMPFHNITNDTIWNIYQEGIQDNICAYLSNFSDALKIRQAESTNRIIQNNGFLNYSSITPTIAGNISAKLNAEIFIYGSIIKAGSKIRVNAQLIDTKTKESFKSFQVEGTSEENIIQLIDSLSAQLKNFLLITRLKLGPNIYLQHYETSASSPEAFRYVVSGNSAFFKSDYPTAREMYSQALAIDSNLYMAALRLVLAYWNPGLIKEAKELCLRIYGKKERMTDFQKIFSEVVYARVFLTPNEALKYVNQLLEIDDELPQAYYMLGHLYDALQKFDKVIPPLEKSLEIFDRWNVKPIWIANYWYLGVAYHKTGQYRKEKRLYKKAEQDFPGDFDIICRQAALSLTEGETASANDYIEKLTAIAKEYSFSEEDLATIMASLYSDAGLLDKTEEYYRKALSLESGKGWILNNLAYFLIDKDRNINEGMKLVERALKLEPDNFYFLACKGWGLYKQGKNREALEFLNKSWELKPVYDHTTYLHLETAKKAVANQKNN